MLPLTSFDSYFKTKTLFANTIHFTNSKSLRTYLEDIVIVRGDGNCAFRVIARHMGLNGKTMFWFVMHLLMS